MRLPLSLAALTFALTACGAVVETAGDVSTSDPLYADLKQTCGADAIVLRVEDLANDEAMCCLTYSFLTPSVHCMTASGATVTNPSDMSKLVQVSTEAKLAKRN